MIPSVYLLSIYIPSVPFQLVDTVTEQSVQLENRILEKRSVLCSVIFKKSFYLNLLFPY